ncbi:hypothetical protein BJ170DRAFT_589587 [Xylariales sp. AK1849]|nr:hypothetical protein BJ170DRAFT_589587 [Xylariales sp. AK1849]
MPGGALRAWALAATLTISTAMSVRPNTLFERDDTCGDPSYTKCPQAGLPDDFCCASGNSCIVLAGATTILCCPEGDCDAIQPIICDLAQQDASTHPQASIKTTVLTGILPTCGNNTCCPFGYSCDGDDGCVKDKDQSKKPDSTSSGTGSSATATSSTPASTSASSAASTATATSSDAAGISSTAAPGSNTPDPATSDSFPTTAVVGGVVGGLVGIICVIAAFMIFRHHRKRQETKRRRESNKSWGNTGQMISHPKPHKSYPNERSDFVARVNPNPSANSTPAQIQNPFDEDNAYSPPFNPGSYYTLSDSGRSVDEDQRSRHSSAMIPPIRGLRNSRRQSGDRQPSGDGEFVDIHFAAPLAVPDFDHSRRDTAMTRWTVLQKHAEQGK